MLQPIVSDVLEQSASSAPYTSSSEKKNIDHSSMQCLVTESQSTMLGPLLEKRTERSTVSTSVHSPTNLNTPVSILPFLTAQGISAFPMTSENEIASPSGSGTLTPNSNSNPSTAGPEKKAELGVSKDLDLNSGWKVVGVTSLSDSAGQGSTHAQQIPVMITDLAGGILPPANANADFKSASSVSESGKSGCKVDATPAPVEWKIVGLTSLMPSNSDVSCEEKSIAPAETVTTSSLSVSVNPACSQSSSSLSQNPKEEGSTRTAQHDFQLPSLVELAAGTSEWKIAGITTLQLQAGSSVAAAGEVDSASLPDDRAVAPVTTAADIVKWKIVGFTSVDCSKSVQSPPTVTASSLSPIPVAMASKTPLVSAPIHPSSSEEHIEWKVVGVVPLSHSEEASADKFNPQHKGSMDETQDKFQNSNLATGSQHQDDSLKSWICNRTHVNASHDSLPLLKNQALEPHPVSAEPEECSHPLAFLTNCSNQFKNTVLKKNTVSTMLELKRAFQGTDSEDTNSVLKRNTVSSMLALKRKYEGTDPEDNFVTCVGEGSPFSVNKADFHSKFYRTGHESEHMNQNVGERQTVGLPPVFSPFLGPIPRDTDFRSLSESCKPASSNQSIEPLEADDKIALANAYRHQVEASTEDMSVNRSCFSLTQSYRTSQENAQSIVPPENRQALRSDDYVKIFKSEVGQPVMAMTDFDSDSVNLTNVDPWGVCTDEDLGEIAEMMSEKEGHKIFHSSSRKRKLSTPRKMVL